jgi:hypothetical protein
MSPVASKAVRALQPAHTARTLRAEAQAVTWSAAAEGQSRGPRTLTGLCVCTGCLRATRAGRRPMSCDASCRIVLEVSDTGRRKLLLRVFASSTGSESSSWSGSVTGLPASPNSLCTFTAPATGTLPGYLQAPPCSPCGSRCMWHVPGVASAAGVPHTTMHACCSQLWPYTGLGLRPLVLKRFLRALCAKAERCDSECRTSLGAPARSALLKAGWRSALRSRRGVR